jgi:hypothetical protein
MADWDEVTAQLLGALRRFVQGDAEPLKSLWSHRDDVTIFGGWGACEQGWAAAGLAIGKAGVKPHRIARQLQADEGAKMQGTQSGSALPGTGN